MTYGAQEVVVAPVVGDAAATGREVGSYDTGERHSVDYHLAAKVGTVAIDALADGARQVVTTSKRG
jgi:hypothetical protein